MSLDSLPEEIADEEQIVRFVLSPVHVETGKKKLKKTVFRPKRGTDLVSVARLEPLGADVCKAKAKELQKDPMKYAGLARISAKSIREAGSQVDDARQGYYPGHAHLSHGFILPDGDPPDAIILKQLNDRCQALLARTTFFPDPEPALDVWTGEPL